jgi:hypothetical protein
MQQQKPSFFSSVVSGIGGWFKGLFSGGVVGAIGGGLLLTALAVGGALIAGNPVTWALAGGAALSGATIGASVIAPIGALAGAVTGVVKNREAANPSAGELVNALNMAHQHGQMVGVQQGVAMSKNHWRNRISQENQAIAIAQGQ